MGLIGEGAKLALNGETLRAFLDVTDDLGIDVEGFADSDDLLCNLGTDINLHAMSHIKHLVHLFPVGAGALVDGVEEWGHGEHVVLNHATVVIDEV